MLYVCLYFRRFYYVSKWIEYICVGYFMRFCSDLLFKILIYAISQDFVTNHYILFVRVSFILVQFMRFFGTHLSHKTRVAYFVHDVVIYNQNRKNMFKQKFYCHHPFGISLCV